MSAAEALNDGIYAVTMTPLMLMIVLSRIGRRIEAREAGKFALSTDRPLP